MTTPSSYLPSEAAPDAARFAMYTPEFAADPHSMYDTMRTYYPEGLVPVDLAPGVPASLVISHSAAVRILNDPEHFPADPRTWQETIPQDSAVLGMMQWQPAARNNSGELHVRYREPSAASIDGVDLFTLPAAIERLATPLIDKFCTQGHADLMMQYAFPVALEVINHVCGCPAGIGEQIAVGMAARFDTVRAAEGMGILKTALMELISLKREHPGNDATSRLIEHANDLDNREVFAQLLSFYGAGFEAQRNLVANAVLLMITEDRYRPGFDGGNLSTTDAVDHILFNDPPMANFCTTYPQQPVSINHVWLPPNQPVVISMAACNNDPTIRHEENGYFVGNRAHLAWSIGPHACPAQSLARTAVTTTIDVLLNALPDLTPALPTSQLEWRPGPFHRALASLPVVFEPTPPIMV